MAERDASCHAVSLSFLHAAISRKKARTIDFRMQPVSLSKR